MRLKAGDKVTVKSTGCPGVVKASLGRGYYRVLVAIQDKPPGHKYWEQGPPIYYRTTYRRGSLFVWWLPTILSRLSKTK